MLVYVAASIQLSTGNSMSTFTVPVNDGKVNMQTIEQLRKLVAKTSNVPEKNVLILAVTRLDD